MSRSAALFVQLAVVAWLACPAAAVDTAIAEHATKSLVTVPLQSLYGGAAWAVVLHIGTPPIQFGLYVDTGSSDLSVTKAGCIGCSPIGQAYNPSNSSTSAPVSCDGHIPDGDLRCAMCVNNTCADSITYITGSLKQQTNFQLYLDELHFGGLQSLTPLGAFYNMTNRPHLGRHDARLLQPQSGGLQDGIIGLGFTSRSVARSPNLVESFAYSGRIPAPQFSMTLNRLGGALTLGGVGPYVTSAVTWTAVTTPGFWQLGLKAVALGDHTLEASPESYNLSIVDTGTPTVNLPTVPYNDFVKQLLATCSTPQPLPGICNVTAGQKSLLEGGCAALSPKEVALFPDLAFTIQGQTPGSEVALKLPASAYLAPGWYACPGQGASPYPQRAMTVVHEAGWMVLGGPMLQYYDVVYDMAGKGRVGWAVSSSQ